MGEAMGGIGAIGILLIGVFLIVLCVLWVVLPFAIFGTKDRLDMLITETKRQNILLAELRDSMKRTG